MVQFNWPFPAPDCFNWPFRVVINSMCDKEQNSNLSQAGGASEAGSSSAGVGTVIACFLCQPCGQHDFKYWSMVFRTWDTGYRMLIFKSQRRGLPWWSSDQDSTLRGMGSIRGWRTKIQARILEWVAISSSRGSSRPRDWTHISCLAGRFFTTVPPGKPLLHPLNSS